MQKIFRNLLIRGVVAQLVERLVRNEKVAGSIPVGSTILRSELPQWCQRRWCFPSLLVSGGGPMFFKVPSYGWQAIMKIFVAAITLLGLIFPALTGSAAGADLLGKKNIGLYEVNLVCLYDVS